jgi:hypothetical protein
MIIECSYCKSKVDAKVLASHQEYDPEGDPWPSKISLVVCPSCNNSLLGIQEEVTDQYGTGWSSATRVWPDPKRYIPWSVPPVVRTSLDEAERCINGGAYTAAVAMCGRALEGICRHFNTKDQFLGGGVKELLVMGIIDNRIYQWSEELRKHRNIAAHAGDKLIRKEDAADLFDFVVAISEYIFVLAEKFNQFMNRQKDDQEEKDS